MPQAPQQQQRPWWETVLAPDVTPVLNWIGQHSPDASPAATMLKGAGSWFLNPELQPGGFGANTRALGGWVARGGAPAPTPTAPSAMPEWNFSAGPAADASQMYAGAKPSLTAEQMVLSMYPDAKVTNTDRTPADMERLKREGYNPATHSQHNAWEVGPGHAVDFIPPEGTDPQQVVSQLTQAGMWSYYNPKDGHIHADTRNMRDPFTMPQLPQMDPKAAAAAIPLPGPVRHVTLEAPPPTPESGPRPQEDMPPTDQWMSQLAALAPKAFDEKEAKRGELIAVLSGIANGAANADARNGVGAMLAAIGAGASSASATWQSAMRAERKEADEAQRLYQLGLARQGIDFWNARNDVRQRNREREYNDTKEKLLNQHSDQMAQWETQTKQTLLNNGIDRDWDSEMLQARTTQARTALATIDGNVSRTTQQILGQSQLDLKRFLFEDEKSNTPIGEDASKWVYNTAASLGIDPKLAAANKDIVSLNALQGLAYMHANNKPAAINSLARELILSGQWQQLVTDPTLKKNIETIARQSPELAAATLGTELNKDEMAQPGTVLGLAKLGASLGLPTATAFTRLAKLPEVATPVGQNTRKK